MSPCVPSVAGAILLVAVSAAGCGSSASSGLQSDRNGSAVTQEGSNSELRDDPEGSVASDCAYLEDSLDDLDRQIARETRDPREGETDRQRRGREAYNSGVTEALFLEWAAATWPQVTDPDLKSALREIAEERNVQSNMASVDAICFRG